MLSGNKRNREAVASSGKRVRLLLGKEALEEVLKKKCTYDFFDLFCRLATIVDKSERIEGTHIQKGRKLQTLEIKTGHDLAKRHLSVEETKRILLKINGDFLGKFDPNLEYSWSPLLTDLMLSENAFEDMEAWFPYSNICPRAEELVEAAQEGDVGRVSELLSAGVDPNVEPPNGTSALIKAVQNERIEVVRILITAGAAVDARDRRMVCLWTPLMIAAHQNLVDIMRVLIEGGADVDLQEGIAEDSQIISRGRTALMIAANKAHLASVRVLVEADADMSLLGNLGQTAMQIAQAKGYSRIVEYFHRIERGAAPEDVGSPGRSIYEFFVSNKLYVEKKERLVSGDSGSPSKKENKEDNADPCTAAVESTSIANHSAPPL